MKKQQKFVHKSQKLRLKNTSQNVFFGKKGNFCFKKRKGYKTAKKFF